MKYKVNETVQIKHDGVIDSGIISCIDADGIIVVKSAEGLLYELSLSSIRKGL